MANTQIFIIGDLHGSFKPIRNFYKYNNQKYHLDERDNVLIILGDAGFNYFFNERDNEVKEKIGKYPFTYFIIRGNHEQRPSICMEKNLNKWHEEMFCGNTVYVENKYSYIKYARDDASNYSAEVAGQSVKVLVIPGAYSVDKYKRIQMGWSWFEQEQLSQEEMDLGLKLIEREPAFDLVLSHTCPICYEPTDLFIPSVDQSLVDKTMEQYLGKIESKIDYKLWFWGHYHKTRVYPKNGHKQPIMLFQDIINLEDWLINDTYQITYLI